MHLFFDLDGTLTDSSPGIVRCINHALVALGYAPLSDERLRPMIGAPLVSIFREVLNSEDIQLVDAAVETYRQRFNTVGIFENSLFPGIAEALDELCHAGHRLHVVTAKPAVAARRVVDHFQIARYFGAVHGPALTDRHCDKGDLVSAALRVASGHLGAVAMVGDRAADIRAARRNEVRAVAAGWGYGSEEELLAARPEYLAPTVIDLLGWVQTAG
jgi:phosphoglycolate phosphatase